MQLYAGQLFVLAISRISRHFQPCASAYSRDQLRNFQRGLCNYGDNCKYSHVVLRRWKMNVNHGCCLPTITTLAIRHSTSMKPHEAMFFPADVDEENVGATCFHAKCLVKVGTMLATCWKCWGSRRGGRELFSLFHLKDVHWQGLCDPLHCNSVVASCDGSLWASAPRIWWWCFLVDRFLVSEGCDLLTYRG